MKIIILGAGLAGISVAYCLQDNPNITEIEIIEKESEIGGLCRSFEHNGITVDIGPHIFFSKDSETLAFMLDLLGDNKHQLRRSNRIIHNQRFVQYPFENDLSKLSKEDIDYCVNKFLNNPYRNYHADNMLQFFLKTFGEGITNLYLRPYNEKIWKFDPSFMDTQMVERIPCPSDEDIINSARGETIDGYTHQLYFTYPMHGGMGAFMKAFSDKLNSKVKIYLNEEVTQVSNNKVITTLGEYFADSIVSCLPPQVIADEEIKPIVSQLRYNNIMIAMATVSIDRAGDNFAFMIADKDVIFHRLSKVDFLGDKYHKDGTATYMLEYTYHDGDIVANLNDSELQLRFTDGLKKIGFIQNATEVMAFTLKRFPFAYVIYDLHHKTNMIAIREHFAKKGILLNGRFGNFEYWNMDNVIAQSKKVAQNFNQD